ncbi:hypothetical protein ACCT09_49550, partial [Rhizobium ruizarguesonis]
GRNAVEYGKTVAGGASLAGPKAGAGRDGRNRRGVLMKVDVADPRSGIPSLTSPMNGSAGRLPHRPSQ